MKYFLRGGAVAAVGGIALAAVLGGLSAFFAVIFFEGAGAIHRRLGVGSDVGGGGQWALVLAPMAAGLLCALIKRKIHVPFYGLADTMLAAARARAQPWRESLASMAASFIAFGGGASVGQYGPVGHLGGFVGGWFRRWWAPGVGPACGVAAAIAAAFNAPVTGLLFAHEVILRHYSVRAFAPITVSAVAGYMVSVGIFQRPPFLSIGDMQSVAASDFFVFGAQGAIFGVLSALYLRMIFSVGRRLSRVPDIPLLVAVGGVCGLLWLAVPTAAGGRDLLYLAVSENLPGGWSAVLLVGAVKTAATVLCLGAGFAGGVVSPTLVIGAMGGVLYAGAATVLGIYDGPLFVPVVCGMMAFTAPVIGAPLAAILFVLELSGGNYPLTVAASLSVALSVLAAGRISGGSYYEQQLHERGVDIKHAREQWQLTSQRVGDLPINREALTLADSLSAAAAARQMLAAAAVLAFVVDENNGYAGVITLSQAGNGGDSPLRQVMSEAPCLREHDTLAAALQTAAGHDMLAVADAAGVFVGAVRESDLLRARQALVSRLREQERV